MGPIRYCAADVRSNVDSVTRAAGGLRYLSLSGCQDRRSGPGLARSGEGLPEAGVEYDAANMNQARGAMNSNDVVARHFEIRRVARGAAASLLVAAGLAACGGGSSVGTTPITPAPVACTSSSLSSADGYAIGACASTKTGVFLDVTESVAIPAPVDSYILTLLFPTALQTHGGSTSFTSANLASIYGRDVLGALQGSVYENPLTSAGLPPYTALTDFHNPCCYHANAPWPAPQLQYLGYGTWEKAPGGAEGFVGVWYGSGAGTTTVVNTRPTSAMNRVYRGYVVGMIGPDEDAGVASYLDSIRSFSAPIEIVVDGTGHVVSGTIEAMLMFDGYDTSVSPPTIKAPALPIAPMNLAPTGATIDTDSGALGSASGAGATVDTASSRFEAKFFGVPGDLGGELAGKLRIRTSNGLIAVASFGTKFAFFR